jgi:hypothetical protein
LCPSAPETEKITINLGYVDLGHGWDVSFLPKSERSTRGRKDSRYGECSKP